MEKLVYKKRHSEPMMAEEGRTQPSIVKVNRALRGARQERGEARLRTGLDVPNNTLSNNDCISCLNDLVMYGAIPAIVILLPLI